MEERTLNEATHAVVIRSMDVCMPVRFGYWAAVAAGRALARASGGVLVDIAVPRWLERSTYENPVPPMGEINIWEEIIVPQSIDDRGHLWITTSGLKKWSLPELQIKNAPPNLGESLLPVVNAVAHVLMERLAGLTGTGENPPDSLTLEPELRLDFGAITRSRHVEAVDPPEGARGWTLIGLQYEPRRDGDSFLTLKPPSGFRGAQGVWLNSLLSDLLGTQDTLRHVDHDQESMEAAHMQAVGELPAMRQRFQAGLQPGEHLFVKHGFPYSADKNEYMWLAVNTWQGDRLRCELANDPHYRKDLRAGQTVELTEDQIFDWMLMRPDGSQYGGWTNRVVEREGKR
jgi:uncharacterized protein YegJ (DUF2314 family)